MELRSYQREGVNLAVKRGVLLSAQEMRMGKTATAIVALKEAEVSRALICGPAVSRTVWLRELDKWWPEHPPVAALLPGKPVPTTPFVVCSYEGLSKIDPESPWDALVFDESIYLKDSRSKRAEAAFALRKTNQDALAILLSGMPLSLTHADLWSQLNILEPYAWGTYSQFVKRYCLHERNQFSSIGKITGINEAYLPELKERMSYCVQRVVKSDYPGLFPPLTVEVVEVKGKAGEGAARKFLAGEAIDFSALEGWLTTSASLRVDAVVDWAAQTERGVIFTWLRSTAKLIAEKLGAILITGDESPEKRQARLDDWKPGDIVVATMASCKTAIDMSFANSLLFAELYWSPETVGQALMRLHKAGGDPVVVTLLKVAGSIDEAMCSVLGNRLRMEEQTLGLSDATKGLVGAVGPKIETVDDWAARLGSLVEAE